jgi:hypothetical protein
MEFKSDHIIISDKEIIAFYRDNSNLNFVAMNHIFIDILKSLSSDLSNTVSNSMNAKILAMVMDVRSHLNTVQSNVVAKFNDSFKAYIEDIKTILTNNSLTNNEKIGAFIEKSNDALLAKTSLIINEVVPKSNDKNYLQIEKCIDTFSRAISQDTARIIELSSKDVNHSDAIIKDIEVQFTKMVAGIQQPIFSFIQSSEERTFSSIQSIKESLTAHQIGNEKLHTDMSEFLNKYNNNSSSKGNVSEAELYYMLQSILPSDEIVKVNSETASCDLKVNRMDQSKPSILFENKDYVRSVPTDEVKKFERDLRTQNSHGVFISQKSPITFKSNFQIDVINGLIHIYIPNANHDANKLKIAVDIIDNLSSRLEIVENSKPDDVFLCKEKIDDIIEEYKAFALQKSQMIETIKLVTKQLIDKMEEIQLPKIRKLFVKMGAPDDDAEHKCLFCNAWSGKNKASLSAHTRNCKSNPKNKDGDLIVVSSSQEVASLQDTPVVPIVSIDFPIDDKGTIVKNKKVKK